MSKYNPCPCHSKVLYHKCCKPFHDGMMPENALQLMRSRYSAYALQLVDYIMATTHKDNPVRRDDRTQWRHELMTFAKHASFDGLKIIEFIDGDNDASVTFTAELRHEDEDISFTEKSLFEKIDNRWLYKSGEVC